MPKFVAVINIRPTMIFEVSPRTFHAIVKSAPLNIVEFPGQRIPLLVRRAGLLVLLRRRRCLLAEFWSVPAHQVRHRPVVSAPESIAKCLALLRRKMRMTKNFMIADVGMTVHLHISSSGFHPFMETLPLDFVEFLGWSIPTRAGGRPLLSRECAGHRHNRHSHEQSNCRN